MASSREIGPGKFQVLFRFGGKQHGCTLKGTAADARRAVAEVDAAIRDVERGILRIPDGADPRQFLWAAGRELATVATKAVTLDGVLSAYFAGVTPGSKQASSLETERVHARHLSRLMGPKSDASSIGPVQAQAYSDSRAAEGVSGVTIGKELGTLIVILKWAARAGVIGRAPGWGRGAVARPKGLEKPPFQTWAEIERAIKLDLPTPKATAEMWERLWLDQGQTLACLGWVKANSRHAFLPPMFAFAAYTGARRSEILRSRRSDWDFPGSVVAIRQKKADTSRQFTRRMVAIHADLALEMAAWFEACPGSPWAASTADGEPIGPRMATKYFRSCLKDGPWEAIHGWHTFRHSLASNLASSGVDRRLIDDMLGHHTDEMARRYRHLLPANRNSAINSLFARG